MIITLSGDTGCGKTSAAKTLAAKLGYRHYSMGDLRGKLALDRGMTIDELNRQGEHDPFSDLSVDEYQKKLGQTEDDFIVDGRLSWFFIPQAFKVLLTCDPMEAARRIFDSRQKQDKGRDDEPLYASAEDARRTVAAREDSDLRRYAKYYHVSYRDPSHYDLIVDTTKNAGPEQTADQILAAIKNRPQS